MVSSSVLLTEILGGFFFRFFQSHSVSLFLTFSYRQCYQQKCPTPIFLKALHWDNSRQWLPVVGVCRTGAHRDSQAHLCVSKWCSLVQKSGMQYSHLSNQNAGIANFHGDLLSCRWTKVQPRSRLPYPSNGEPLEQLWFLSWAREFREKRDLRRGRPMLSSQFVGLVCLQWSRCIPRDVLRTLVVHMGNSSRPWERGCPVKIQCLCSVILWQTLLTLLRQQHEKLQRKPGCQGWGRAREGPDLTGSGEIHLSERLGLGPGLCLVSQGQEGPTAMLWHRAQCCAFCHWSVFYRTLWRTCAVGYKPCLVRMTSFLDVHFSLCRWSIGSKSCLLENEILDRWSLVRPFRERFRLML